MPRIVESNGNFLVSTESLKCVEDIKCDDGGSWVNNGVRKVYLHIRNEKYCKKMKVEVANDLWDIQLFSESFARLETRYQTCESSWDRWRTCIV